MQVHNLNVATLPSGEGLDVQARLHFNDLAEYKAWLVSNGIDDPELHRAPAKATIPGEVNAPAFGFPQPADPYAGPGIVGPGTDDSGESAT